ncbi:hypothetical protein Hdeb2414_s0018g00524621 [Helianthus debilis subsp. tardiflorus]
MFLIKRIKHQNTHFSVCSGRGFQQSKKRVLPLNPNQYKSAKLKGQIEPKSKTKSKLVITQVKGSEGDSSEKAGDKAGSDTRHKGKI